MSFVPAHGCVTVWHLNRLKWSGTACGGLVLGEHLDGSGRNAM
jgi:hypothetical protein